MIYLATASKDSSVYSLYPTKNTGYDEIITISKAYTIYNESDIARSYIQFDIEHLPSYVTASSKIATFHLSKVEELPVSFSLYSYPVISSWDMGVGTWSDDVGFNIAGVTWNTQPSIDYGTSASMYFSYQTSDYLNLNIGDIYDYWIANGNYGMVLQHSTTVESSSLNYGYLKYYSKETNTFLQPFLQIGWNDQVYVTGSLTSIGESEIIIKTQSPKTYYVGGKRSKVNLTVRNKFPIKQFASSFSYLSSSYLPQTSYYSIVDVITGNQILNFSPYTKISCNPTGSYIIFDSTNFPTNRPLKFNFMVDRDGYVEYYEDDTTFIIK